jgi:hypothetical protein
MWSGFIWQQAFVFSRTRKAEICLTKAEVLGLSKGLSCMCIFILIRLSLFIKKIGFLDNANLGTIFLPQKQSL